MVRSRPPRRRLVGETAIVTGGASGIGRALGAQLVSQGAGVILADVDGDGAQRAAGELADRAGDDAAIVGRQLDVRDERRFASVVDEAIDRHGSLDLLFNNAGISLGGPTHQLTAAHWQRVIDVNLHGVVNGIRAAYPRMIEQGHGHIVNTASGAGLVAPPFVAAYAMTKHAVVGLSSALRPEAALHGVRVSVLCPGAVETPILDRPPPADLPAPAPHPVTARDYLAVVGQTPIPAERFARAALDQVIRNRSVIVVPPTANSLWWLHRLSPRLTDRLMGVIARRIDRELVPSS